MKPFLSGMLLLAGFVLVQTSACAEVRYEGSGLRDPFGDPFSNVQKSVPEFNPDSIFGSMRLEGILYGTARSKAIINGKIYSLGDVYHSWTLERIEEGSVTFSSNGKEYQLKQNLRKINR